MHLALFNKMISGNPNSPVDEGTFLTEVSTDASGRKDIGKKALVPPWTPTEVTKGWNPQKDE